MTEHEASRTLVKSPPELWAELSDQLSLAGHLAEPFGEIRITRLEPETAVAWEGERASGTVRIEPAGWGTRVTLTARAARGGPRKAEGQPGPPTPEPAPLPPPVPTPEPLPPAASDPPPSGAPEAPRGGLRGLLRNLLRMRSDVAPEEPPAAKSTPEHPHKGKPASAPALPAPGAARTAPSDTPAAAIASGIDPEAVLVGVLDKLGAAHHRPFSRT